MKAKRRLTDISFEKEGSHVALVHAVQGGPANGVTTLILKATDDITDEDLESLTEEISKATKKEGDETLSASAYAYVPDPEKSSTWKLRIDDANHTRAAVAALGEGFRGNKVQIPAEDLPAVKRKVKAAYKKFFPENEIPTILKSLEEVKLLEQEIQKAVEAAEAVLKAQVKEKEEALEKALAEVQTFKAEKLEIIAKARKEKLAVVVSAEEAEALYKATESLADEAFEAIFKSLEVKAKIEKESDLFVEKGVSGEGEPVKQEEAGLKLVGELINKSKKQ